MQRTPMARSGIARLNQIARRIEQRNGGDGPAAVIAAAQETGLIMVTVLDESGVLYRTTRNRFVFGWTNVSSLAAGAGFDNQVSETR